MKLLLLNYEFPPLGGGASHAAYHLARELVRRGHSVDVLTGRFGDQPAEEQIDGVRVFRVPSWRKGVHDCGLRGALSFVGFGLFALRRLLRRERYDLLHYFFGLPTGLLALYSFGVRRLPYIVSVRGSDVPGYDATDPRLRWLHRLLAPLTRWIWRRARRVVAVSHGLRELVLQTAPRQRVDVIYNGIDPALFAPPAQTAPSGALRLLCVSRLIDRKGIEYLLRALARIDDPRVCLTIIGSGSGERQLRGIAHALGLDGRVQFQGFRPQHELPPLYGQADAFVLPSIAESFGRVLIEAMSSGLPVVASRVGGIPEVIKHGENGLLVDPRNAHQIAEAILTLARDPALRARLGENNRAAVLARFTDAVMTDRFLAIYEEALNGASA